jgi:hypothetical protein
VPDTQETARFLYRQKYALVNDTQSVLVSAIVNHNATANFDFYTCLLHCSCATTLCYGVHSSSVIATVAANAVSSACCTGHWRTLACKSELHKATDTVAASIDTAYYWLHYTMALVYC